MKLYIVTTRYIDGYFFLFCLTEKSKPVTLCVVHHKTYLYARTKLAHNAPFRDLRGERIFIKRDLASIGIELEEEEIEIKQFHDVQSFSFHQKVHYKIPVVGYEKLLEAKKVLSKLGHAVPEFPEEDGKLFSDLGIHHTQWIEVDGNKMKPIKIRDYARKRESEEYAVVSDAIKGIETDVPAPEVMEMVFDIETYSSRYGINNSLEMPNHTRTEDVVYMISVVLTWSNNIKPEERVCFAISPNGKIPRDFVQTCESEEELISEFFRFIRERDPDVIYGHNSSSYDFNYISGRLTNMIEDIEGFGRLKSFSETIVIDGTEFKISFKTRFTEKFISNQWEGAGGTWHDYHYPACYGRVILDTLILLKKLPSSPGTPGALQGHSLDKLGAYLIGETKTGMTYAETFFAFRSGDVERIGEIADYCMQDSMICMKLFHITGEWVATREASYIYYQDVNEVTVTGQRLKMYRMFLRKAEEMGFLFHPIITNLKFKVQGGHVETPIKGKHCDVGVIDFASLYPSIMMAMNICLSTYIKSLPKVLPAGYKVEDFDRYEIPIEVGVREMPARYEEAEAPPGTIEEVVTKKANGEMVVAYKWKPDSPGTGFVDDPDSNSSEINGELLDDELYIKEIIRYNRLNPDYGDSFVEMLRARFGKAQQKIYQNLVFYVAKKEIRNGIIPIIQKELKDKRGEAKKKMKIAKESGDSITYEMFNQRQSAIKVVMNSIYGVLGSVHGKMSALEVAAAVTFIGRKEILRVKGFLENHGFRIIYGDTDSLMFQVPGYGEEERRKKDPTSIKLSAPVTEGVVETITQITEEINKTMIDPMKMEFEKVMNGIFVDRKRYMAYVTYEDGKYYATPGKPTEKDKNLKDRPIYVRGAASVRGDTTPFARQAYSATLSKILSDESKESVEAFIEEKKEELRLGKVPNSLLSVSKTLSHSYANDNAPMKKYAQHLLSIGERADPGTKIPLVIIEPPEGYSGPLSEYWRLPNTKERIHSAHYIKLMVSSIEKLKQAAFEE
jgi:DNA polymerase elongation subunit (family B)